MTAAATGFFCGGNPFAIALLAMMENIVAVGFSKGLLPLLKFFWGKLTGDIRHRKEKFSYACKRQLTLIGH
jgi:hypothetical protein